MVRRRARPNEADCEFLLYLIYSEDRGKPLAEFASDCQHYNRWQPTEYTLRAALARLVEHGLVSERNGRYFAAEAAVGRFNAARDPAGDPFDDLDALKRAVLASSDADGASG